VQATEWIERPDASADGGAGVGDAGGFVAYSLGNFIFDQEWSLETKQGFILHLVFDGVHFAGYRVVPVLIEDYHRPRIVEDEMRSIILGRFWESTSLIANTPID
jgi:poly-gamma-glutamate synthesis protein (capsule biosynthesis protein)